jgi:nucleoside-diphosphate-sugar epimerase
LRNFTSQFYSRSLFLPSLFSSDQFMEEVLSKGQQTNFFTDEYRTPTYIEDICRVIIALVSRARETGCAPRAIPSASAASSAAAPSGSTNTASSGIWSLPRVWNVGCPERLSRRDMAEGLCRVRGFDPSLITPARRLDDPASAKFIPLDISMVTERAERELGVKMTPYEDALREMYGTAATSGHSGRG